MPTCFSETLLPPLLHAPVEDDPRCSSKTEASVNFIVLSQSDKYRSKKLLLCIVEYWCYSVSDFQTFLLKFIQRW